MAQLASKAKKDGTCGFYLEKMDLSATDYTSLLYQRNDSLAKTC
jgi:hypothetical protein